MKTLCLRTALPALACMLAALFPAARAHCQIPYRNVVNNRFATVANGPMQALVVDVPDANDREGVQRAVAASVNAARKARAAGLKRELDYLRSVFHWRKPVTPGVPDIVYLRQINNLLQPANRGATRAPGLTFTFPVSQKADDMGWTQAQATELSAIAQLMNTALTQVYGAPSWSGTVPVFDGDNAASIVTDPNALSGGVYNVSLGQIVLAQYNAFQSIVYNLTQMMAIAYHGPASISYDAWERGMARAATLEAVRTVIAPLNNLASQYGAGPMDLSDPLWHALDRYDLMNQPPLGNDRFFPVSQVNGVANTSSFPNMLVPRLMMSGSAWLKCQAESQSFLASFNSAYYTAWGADHTVANNVPALKSIAAQVLPTVEGQPFTTSGGTPGWYEQQYVLDTSVSPGYKLYALPSALPPSGGADDPAIAVVLYYYQTTFDSNGNSNEVNQNGTSFPIYWDYTFTNRLFLGAQYERVDIRDGVGAVAPTFPNTLGGANGNAMRVAMDFPIGFQNVRLYVAPRNMGTQEAPNNFWGTVVGTDTGTLRLQTDTGVDTTVNVVQGSFGTAITAGNPFTRPSKATLTFKDTAGTTTVRNVNIAYNEYIPVLVTGNPVQSLSSTIAAGPSMIGFPIQPLKPRAEDALLNPNTDQPIFGHTNLLLAQWRQDINDPNGDDYEKYPTLDPIQPGKGYWSNFASSTPVKVYGRVATPDQQVSLALLHGWNQISDPYTVAVPLANLTFQDQANNVGVDLQTAINNGWIGVTNFPTLGQFPIFGYAQAGGYQPVATGGSLQPWQGYWIRVLVSEGVTITFANPTPGGKAVVLPARTRAAAPAPAPGWAVPITVHSPDGFGATAWLGQSSNARSAADTKMNVLAPPAVFGAVPSIVFRHPDLGAAAGDYMTEAHPAGSVDPWELTVSTPDAKKTYTLTWSNLASVPRSVQLVLVDEATGTRHYMRSSSGYSFAPGTAVTRKFQVAIEDHSRSRLVVMGVMARQTRAAGGSSMEIQYTLTQGASVTTEVMGGDGRLVRRIDAGRAVAAGTSSLLWDLRDSRSRAVPTGTYLVQITATTPVGETVRTVQPITIVR